MLVALLITLGLLTSAGASAATEGGRVTASGFARGTTPINTQTVEGKVFDNDPKKVKGYATASPLVGGVPTGHFNGPLTCLDIRGHVGGATYQFDSTSTAFVGQVIYATAIDGGPGKPDRLGFIGPLPASAFPDCAPRPELAVLPFTGELVLKDGSWK